MIRHVVVFRWEAGTTEDQLAAILAGLAALERSIPSLRRFHFGQDVGVNPANGDLAVTADFDDLEGYVAYRDHPAHQAFIRDTIGRAVADRLAVQFEL